MTFFCVLSDDLSMPLYVQAVMTDENKSINRRVDDDTIDLRLSSRAYYIQNLHIMHDEDDKFFRILIFKKVISYFQVA